MKLYPVIHEYFKLDGGAMFGVVPKVIWQRTNPADEDNLIQMVTRSLLVDTGDKLILIDTGMGDKQSEKFFGYYKPLRKNELDKVLSDLGYTRADITDVVMTHLHFDHCGGSVIRDENGNLIPAFPKARYWTNEAHWRWAVNPNPRERASFLKENFIPLQEAGVLHFVPLPDKGNITDFPELNMRFLFADGHTEKQMIPIIEHEGKTLVYMADLLPTTGHIPLPYVMGYDIRPLVTLKEKEQFLNKAADKGYYLFLEHDPETEVCTVKHTEKGVRLDKTYQWKEIFNR
jgi:glyoxylase-like metal-dependent hydrolase (beta-lactamase superfamily II)